MRKLNTHSCTSNGSKKKLKEEKRIFEANEDGNISKFVRYSKSGSQSKV